MKPVVYMIPIWRYRKDAGFEEERKFSKFRPAKVNGFGIELKRKEKTCAISQMAVQQ